jgi:hypothetical protein
MIVYYLSTELGAEIFGISTIHLHMLWIRQFSGHSRWSTLNPPLLCSPLPPFCSPLSRTDWHAFPSTSWRDPRWPFDFEYQLMTPRSSVLYCRSASKSFRERHIADLRQDFVELIVLFKVGTGSLLYLKDLKVVAQHQIVFFGYLMEKICRLSFHPNFFGCGLADSDCLTNDGTLHLASFACWRGG